MRKTDNKAVSNILGAIILIGIVIPVGIFAGTQIANSMMNVANNFVSYADIIIDKIDNAVAELNNDTTIDDLLDAYEMNIDSGLADHDAIIKTFNDLCANRTKKY